MLSSLRVRLTLSHLVVIVLAMGLSGFLLLSFAERYFLQATEDSLITQARITAQTLIPGSRAKIPPGQAARQTSLPAYNNTRQQQVGNLALQTDNVLLPTEGAETDLAYLTEASLQFSAQLETRIRVVDAMGRTLVDSWQETQGTNLADDPLVRQALGGQYASQTTAETMQIALPILVEERVAGAVYLSQPLQDITTVLGDLRRRWLLATGIALLLSGGVGLLLSQAIARPLRRLTTAAGAVARGQFDHQVPVRSRDEVGRLSRAFNDMTTRLQAARQMQIDFVANVSHELRTPLTSIKGIIETLQDGAVEDLAVRDRFLQTVEEETDRLIRLVNQLLLLSRTDSEALNLRREPTDLAQLTCRTVEKLAGRAETGRVTLRAETNGRPLPAWIDPDRIGQVLVNLLDNAIKYSPPGGAVTVRVEPGQNGLRLVRVADQGIGIPAADLPHIGQRFYRADKARSRAEGGSGLGLAIAQALVQAHGGQLWLESEEGRGTVVSFTLPGA